MYNNIISSELPKFQIFQTSSELQYYNRCPTVGTVGTQQIT